jgi:hypothetical protein
VPPVFIVVYLKFITGHNFLNLVGMMCKPHTIQLTHTRPAFLVPLALQPTVGFGLSKKILPFFFPSVTNSASSLNPASFSFFRLS